MWILRVLNKTKNLPKKNNYNLNKKLKTDLELNLKREENFNKNLYLLDTKWKDDFVFNIWKPSYILRRAWVENLDIELTAKKLKFKSSLEKHPYNLKLLKNFNKKVQDPIAVFDWKYNHKLILTDKTNIDWKNFVSVLRVVNDWNKNRINSIRSIYGRNLSQLKRDFQKIRFLNNTKFKQWIKNNNLDINSFNFLFKK